MLRVMARRMIGIDPAQACAAVGKVARGHVRVLELVDGDWVLPPGKAPSAEQVQATIAVPLLAPLQRVGRGENQSASGWICLDAGKSHWFSAELAVLTARWRREFIESGAKIVSAWPRPAAIAVSVLPMRLKRGVIVIDIGPTAIEFAVAAVGSLVCIGALRRNARAGPGLGVAIAELQARLLRRGRLEDIEHVVITGEGAAELRVNDVVGSAFGLPAMVGRPAVAVATGVVAGPIHAAAIGVLIAECRAAAANSGGGSPAMLAESVDALMWSGRRVEFEAA